LAKRSLPIWASLHPFVEGGQILGRKVANIQWLKAFWEKDPFAEYHFFLLLPEQVKALEEFVDKNFPQLKAKIKILPRIKLASYLKQTDYFCFHLSDCIGEFSSLACLRNFLSRQTFVITAPIHSLSYNSFIYAYLSHLTPVWTPRESIITTTNSGKRVLKNFYAHLKSNYQLAESFQPPKLTTIPLGVADYFFQDQDQKALKQKYDLPAKGLTLIYVGRLAVDSKLDFIPVLRAIGEIRKKLPQQVVLILAGEVAWDQEDLSTIKRLALNIKLDLRFYPKVEEKTKVELLQASDVFLSMIDNFQETFGLSILEAKASGLPVLASNFDGYKELVQDQKDGFLLPTYMPEKNSFLAAFSNLLYDNQTHLLFAQQVGFDLAVFQQKLLLLANNPNLRNEMGQRAKKSAQNYVWSKIIEKHVSLWERLRNTPVQIKTNFPLNFDHFQIFAHYPTQTFGCKDKLKVSQLGLRLLAGQEHPIFCGNVENFLGNLEQLKQTLAFFVQTKSLESFLNTMQGDKDLFLFRIAWLVKHGFLKVVLR